jgi:hypothetical protein
MVILGMFGMMILLGTILNQAVHDDKPPVDHGNSEKMYLMMLFRTKHTKVFFAYVMLNISCLYVLMFWEMLHYLCLGSSISYRLVCR